MESVTPQEHGVYPIQRAEAIRSRIQRYKSILFNYWWILAITISIGVSIQAWQALVKPVTYQSTARIIVSGRVNIPEGTVFSEEAINFFGTQIELMRSPEVARQAAQRVQSLRPDLVPIPVNISVDQIPRTSVFVLTATGSEPEYVKVYLDAVMEAYISLRRSMVSEKSANTLSAITDQIVRLENELRLGENELLEWRKDNNLALLEEEGASAGGYLAKMNLELAELQTEYDLLSKLDLDQNLDRMNAGRFDTPEAANTNQQLIRGLSDATLNASEDYLRVRRELSMKQAELEQKSKTFRPDHPIIQETQDQFNQLRELLEIYRQQSVDQLTSQKESIAIRIENVKNRIAQLEAKALDLSRRLGEYERLKSKLDRQRGLYERLLASVQSVDINSNIQQDVVSVLDYASPPVPSSSTLTKSLGTGAFLGLLAGLGILFLISIIDDRILSIAELQSVFSEEVVGIIPKTETGQSPLIKENDDRQSLLEAFRNVRSWLFFTPWEGRPPKTLLITSSIPEEGKSTVATNLAISLASSGSKVLLIDADLRRGGLHKFFRIEPDPGFGELVAGEVKADRVIYGADIENLYIMPKGRGTFAGSEVFFGKGVEPVFAELSAKFDYIIIDSCPMLAVDDTSSLAPKVDVVFFVVRSGYTSIRLAKKALGLLAARHANVEGIIYNAVDWGASGYAMYNYSRYKNDPEGSGASLPA